MNSSSAKPVASLNVDVDPIGAYLHARGWDTLPETNLNAIYDDALPRMLDLFDEFGVKATFFIVGADLDNPGNAKRIAEMSARGHEIGNHTQNHNLGFAGLSVDEKRREIVEMQKRAEDITGQAVKGFRAPGWNIDRNALNLLEELGYAYDSSVFPSYLNPAMKLAHFLQCRDRGQPILGRPAALALAPRAAYRPDKERIWRRGSRRKLVEIPASVLPGIRFPFYGTMSLQLGDWAFRLSAAYYRLMSGVPLNYILHAIELVDRGVVHDERFGINPGYARSLPDKAARYRMMLKTFGKSYRFVRLDELADSIPAQAVSSYE